MHLPGRSVVAADAHRCHRDALVGFSDFDSAAHCISGPPIDRAISDVGRSHANRAGTLPSGVTTTATGQLAA